MISAFCFYSVSVLFLKRQQMFAFNVYILFLKCLRFYYSPFTMHSIFTISSFFTIHQFFFNFSKLLKLNRIVNILNFREFLGFTQKSVDLMKIEQIIFGHCFFNFLIAWGRLDRRHAGKPNKKNIFPRNATSDGLNRWNAFSGGAVFNFPPGRVRS